MKKILIFCVFFLVSCNYQPIYQNTDLDKIEFLKITLEGDQDINRNRTPASGKVKVLKRFNL